MPDKKSVKEAGSALADDSFNEEDNQAKDEIENSMESETEYNQMREPGQGSNEYSYALKIPVERIAVLIGKGGATKAEIESETGCRLNIDSKEGEVEIKSSDSIKLYTAKDIVRAVARGFNPKTALCLLKQDYVLDIIELRQIMKSIAQMQRLKGRVIGEGGKARKTIEGLTDTSISVYGKTIAIIGEASNVTTAKRAVQSLLSGSNHSTVYNWLEKKRKLAKKSELKQEFRISEGEALPKDIFKKIGE